MAKTPKSEKKEKKDKKDKTPKSAKSTKSDRVDREASEDEDETRGLNRVCAIATPLADLNTTKKILKVVKRGTIAMTTRRVVRTRRAR